MSLKVRPLSPETWDAYAALIQRNGGIWGGCWCMAFHPEGAGRGHWAEGNREAKRGRVMAGEAHAALVFEGEDCLGWCQYGSAAELSTIKHHRKAYQAGGEPAPDWRITCFFVDKPARGRGVAEAALTGALEFIRAAGGGVVESMPEEVAGRKASGAFLFNATLEMFERAGFERVRRLGKHAWLVRAGI